MNQTNYFKFKHLEAYLLSDMKLKEFTRHYIKANSLEIAENTLRFHVYDEFNRLYAWEIRRSERDGDPRQIPEINVSTGVLLNKRPNYILPVIFNYKKEIRAFILKQCTSEEIIEVANNHQIPITQEVVVSLMDYDWVSSINTPTTCLALSKLYYLGIGPRVGEEICLAKSDYEFVDKNQYEQIKESGKAIVKGISYTIIDETKTRIDLYVKSGLL